MSDMEETEGSEGPGVPVAPHRVIGTPPPSPSLLASTEQPSTGGASTGGASTAVAEHGGAVISDEEAFKEHVQGLPPDDPRVILHAKRVERIVAACFILAFIAGCGFIAAYVGLGGLGRFIIDGLANTEYGPVAGGALLVVILALLVLGLFSLPSRLLVPAGLRGAGRDNQ